MHSVTNKHTSSVRLRSRTGVPHKIEPGATKSVAIDPESPHVAGLVTAGLIEISEAKASPRKAAETSDSEAASEKN